MTTLRTPWFALIFIAALWSCKSEDSEVALPRKEAPEFPFKINNADGDFMGCVDVSSQRVTIEMWETSTPDDDRYSLYLNGTKIDGGTLPVQQDRVKLEVDLDFLGYNRLAYYASDYGRISRNSAIISVNGEPREVRSTFETVGYLDIIYNYDTIFCQSEEGEYSDVMFWSTATTAQCTPIPVILTGAGFEVEKSLIYYYHNIAPDCGSAGCATFENLPKGTYTYRAGCDGSRTGTVELSGKPECVKVNLLLL